ncbi:hypothetical protein QTP88_011414 [Uroleucon formosanum]
MPHPDHVAIFETDETNIDSTSTTDSNSCESEPKKLISPTLVASPDLKDPGMWPTTISRSVRDMIVCCAPKFPELVNFVKYMPKDINGKSFSKFMLYSKSSNNRESFSRDWLIWSETKQSLHCLPCILFHTNLTETSNTISILAKREGFCPHKTSRKKLYSKLPTHENSKVHRDLFLEWKTLQQSLIGHGVDYILQKQIKCEADKWKAILRRLLDVTLFLGSRGLSFQGDNSTIGDIHNGNFLGVLELLGKYDEITREHLTMVKQSQIKGESMKGSAHYLSWKSQNEFISLCGDKVMKIILKQREKAIYYSIIADATPDVSHQEQNVLILRYVSQIEKTELFNIYERFIEFINFNEKTGEGIANQLISRLENYKIPLLDYLEHRFQAVKNICNIFEPLLNFLSLTNEELELKTKSLVQKYKYDLSENMCQEMLHLKTIYSSTFQKSHVMPPLELLNSIYAKNVQTIFVNVCISLRIFCTIPVTVAEAERSFSNLGNSLKTWQRSTTSQERLNSLAILSMENELASTINFDDIITEFAELKARRIKF